MSHCRADLPDATPAGHLSTSSAETTDGDAIDSEKRVGLRFIVERHGDH
jgi:hypothetical protein